MLDHVETAPIELFARALVNRLGSRALQIVERIATEARAVNPNVADVWQQIGKRINGLRGSSTY